MSVTPDVAKAAKLASSLALRTIAFEAIEGRLVSAPPAAAASADWALEPPTVTWVMIGREVQVAMPFDVGVTCGAERVYEMHVKLRATYDVRAEADVPEARDLDHYAGISAVLHAWPYLRAEVQSLSVKLGMVAPVVLPNIVASQLPDSVEVKRMKQGRIKVGKGRR
jgi:hypothetical protein